MATTILAPYPGTKVAILLPSAEFSDRQSLEQSVEIRRAMDGGSFSYVKSSQRRTLTLPFELSRAKAIELQRFLKAYRGAEMLLILHDSTRWRAKLAADNFPQNAFERAGGWPGSEAIEIDLVFSVMKL